jgi:CRP-like cAMP-binding protein
MSPHNTDEPTDPREGNRVLAGLSSEDFDRLRPHLEPFEVQAGDVLAHAGDAIAHLHHYVQVLIAQITQAAICNRFHSPRERLSRWLAHTFDRAGTDAIPMTHEFIATMIGGARSLVTQASNELRELGVIDYRRGRLQLLDVRGLREQACECYATVTAAVKTL